MPREWDEDKPLVEKAKGPEFGDGLDDGPVPRTLVLQRLTRTKILPATVDEVIAWGRGQIRNPSQDWTCKCQSFCRQSYQVSAWSGSAIGAWNRIPAKHKSIGGKPGEAPRGALLYYAGGSFGHVAIAIGKKTSDKCLSNDYVRKGKIDVAPRTFPRWGLKYQGWSAWTPFGVLELD